MSLQKASSVQALVCVYNTEDIPAVLMVKVHLSVQNKL